MEQTAESKMWHRLSDADAQYADGAPHGWIQWKGTDVCMDVRCSCGELSHVDADFCYFIKCGGCGAVYAVGGNVKLIPLTDAEVAMVEERIIETDCS